MKVLAVSVVVASWIVLGPFTDGEETRARPPRPLASNAQLPFLSETDLDGTLGIRFSIRKNGKVESWEIVEAPEGIENLEATISDAVRKWRFKPARDNKGARVAGVYEHTLLLSSNQSYELARAYPLASAEVARTFGIVARSLGLRMFEDDREHGAYITEWLPVTENSFSGLEPPEGFSIEEIRYHVFIPQAVEPARVYVNSEVEIWHERERTRMRYYNVDAVGGWLLDRLEADLGQRGVPLPRNTEARWDLFERLVPGSGACGLRAKKANPDDVENPTLIRFTKRKPIYPPGAAFDRETARVVLKPVMYEDGSVGDITVVRSNARDHEFNVSAKQTISFWRYTPPMVDGCPISVTFTVIVNFGSDPFGP